MDYSYEIIRDKLGIPIKISIQNVNEFKMHWHNEMEIILVLKGSINIRVGSDIYLLKENDLILVNRNEIHNTSRTKEDNILLVLQVNQDHNSNYYPGFNKMVFDCKSFMYGEDEQERFDIIRQHLAKIMWEMNKSRRGYQFRIGSEMHLLAFHLVNNFEYSILEDEKVSTIYKNIDRLNSIINYINKNLETGVTLQDIANNENLSIYYLSHFIKKNMGITFQDYINLKRLDKSIELLVSTDKSITEIALESGFPSTKSLNNLIRKTYDCSPTEYRKEHNKLQDKTSHLEMEKEKVRSRTYLDVDRDAAYSKLFTYLKQDSLKENYIVPSLKEEINVDINREGVHHNFYWKNMTTFSRASEGLRKKWQDQLRELQTEVGFRYIRFHGIFSDDMMIYNIADNGKVVYNWSYVDELFDFFKEVKIKPFVELGFMPSEIAKSDDTIFWWKGNISQSKDISLWTDLVKEFIKHCINRYGIKEVETWYFEVWNEPDLEYVFWIGGKEAYFQFYKETVLAVKSISDKLRVGGPAIVHQIVKGNTWLEDFLIYCDSKNVPLDFLTFHIYPESFYPAGEVQDLVDKVKEGDYISQLMKIMKTVKKIYHGKDHTFETINDVHDKIYKFSPYKPEIHITEWSSSSYGRNLINDTSYVATSIVRNVLNSIDKVDSLGYWTFTDIMEELKAGISHFHGGFGLMNKEGLKKPGYFAYYLLSKLGKEIIEQDKEHIVTKDDEDIQILAYNFAYFDELFMSGDTSILTVTERYRLYEDKQLKEIKVNIDNISGRYKVTRYQLNRDHGSVFDEWIRMGNPENMTDEEINYLKGKARPNIVVEYINIDKKYSQDLYIPVHGVELIAFEKQV